MANFSNLGWKDALRFPIVVTKGSRFISESGEVIFNCPIRFGLLRIGSRSTRIVDFKYERTWCRNEGTIVIKGYTWISAGSRIVVYKGAQLNFGENVKITGRTTVICKNRICLGKDCLLSWDIQIMDTDFHKIIDGDGIQSNGDKPIAIGDHVWIGARCTVLKGSRIPNNCIIAAGCVFHGIRDEENCIYGNVGSTISAIKHDIKWSDY